MATAGALALILSASPISAKAVQDNDDGVGAAIRQRIDVVVGLRWRDQAALEELLRGLPDPDSPYYRRYLTTAEFQTHFAPTAETIEATRIVLRDHGLAVVEVSPSGLFLSATGWVTDVTETRNALLSALRSLTQEVRLYFFLTIPNAEGGGEGSGAGEEETELRPPLQVVTLQKRAAESAFTPADIARAYGFDALYERGLDGQRSRSATIAIATAHGFLREDVRRFWSEHGIQRSDEDVELVWVGEPNDSIHLESTVDVQWASALAPESPIIVYAAPEPTTHGFLKIYDRVTSENRAAIMVTSWGACEKQLSLTYLEQAHILFQRAAAQGITVIAASGDRGSDDCRDGETSVDFPASDPNVLAVGGTTLRNDGVFASERAWAGSGGGTSTIWAAPAWQMDPSPKRVLADVAFHADPSPGFVSRYEDRPLVVGGTSLGAPSWAALLALANEARVDVEGVPLGAAGPTLCEAAAMQTLSGSPFLDVTNGDNGAFASATGWDFPTGWGRPRAPALVEAVAYYVPTELALGRAERAILLTPARKEDGGLRVQLFRHCARTMVRLQGRGLAAGDYEVTFNGMRVASFTMTEPGRAVVTVRGVDPRGAGITVTRDGALVFGGHFPATDEHSTRVAVDLDSTGMYADASGLALYQRRRGRERFTVRVRNLLPGVYDLSLGGSVVAPLTVPEGQTSGQVSFNILGALGGYRPNNPVCDSISILRDGATVLRTGSEARGADICR